MKTDVPCTYRRLSDTTLCNLCDRRMPGARVACASVRVTTQRSAVVTRTYSGFKCLVCKTLLNARPTAPGIMVSIAKYFFAIGNDKRKRLVYTSRTQKVLSVATACTVAIKAPPGRATGASAKAAIHLQNRAVSKGLSIFEKRTAHGPVLSTGDCLFSTHELCARRLPMAVVLPCSFSTTAGSSCLLQRRCISPS